MKWWQRSAVFYGLAAGMLLAAVGVLGFLLILWQAPKWETLPPDVPADRQWHDPAVTLDPFGVSTASTAPPTESSAPTAKVSPATPHPVSSSAIRRPVITQTATPGTKGPVPTVPPVITVPSVPLPTKTPKPGITVHVPIPLLPGVNVNVPPLFGVSTGG
jgi:hypothetical protein